MPFEMTGSTRRKTLILLGMVMIIMMIIAASLPRLELQPGMPLPRLENNQVVIVPVVSEPQVSISVNKFFSVFFALILAGSMLYVFFRLLRGADWKSITGFILRMVAISLITVGFVYLFMLLPSSGSSISTEMPVPTTVPPVTAPLGSTPPVLFWLVGIVLLVIGVMVGIWILTSSSRRAIPIELVGLEAEKAWQALINGLDLKDVIIKCYRQMSLALEKEQGIRRKDFMTTGEFEELLEATGIPHDPIHQLTRLFEAVRYGNWQPNPVDEQKAIQCLEAIMLYSRTARGTS
jgi:hypothetical protein